MMTNTRLVMAVDALAWGIPCATLFSWSLSSRPGAALSFWQCLTFCLPLFLLGGVAFHVLLRRRLRAEAARRSR